ncbi:MAG: DNA polymerase III subunit gamma/tau [Phycisphaerales bacterium]
MSYTVLARRYRSRSFDEIVGQEAVARTLRNAIEQDRVAHAYLFVGTRGVGKTSMARIFAKALNGGSEEVDVAIMSGRDTDVIEIDAASNNKVEEARELIANSIYRPLRGQFKIYIIDEVHMLSTAAFNALLKTLEEPPEHVKFILCTTESHKVPATIQSRCQRFDFRNISTNDIAGHLRWIVEEESLSAEEDVLHAIARFGSGSMRDALSLMDRLVAACPRGETLTMSMLEELLGLPDRELIVELVNAIADGDPGATLDKAQQLLDQGVAQEQLVQSLVERFRDLLVVRACGAKTRLLEQVGPWRDLTGEQARRFDEAGLIHLIALCESAQRIGRGSASPRVVLDATLVRMAMTEQVADAAALLEASGGGPGPKK